MYGSEWDTGFDEGVEAIQKFGKELARSFARDLRTIDPLSLYGSGFRTGVYQYGR